jgi:hypothetical protein
MAEQTPHNQGYPQPAGDAPDDVDRLFAHLTQLPPPRGFAESVLLAAQAAREAQARPERWTRAAVAWAAAALAAVLAMALLAFAAGQVLVGGGALALAGALAGDTEVALAAPVALLVALADALPWLELLGVGVALLALRTCVLALGRTLVGASGTAPRAGAV